MNHVDPQLRWADDKRHWEGCRLVRPRLSIAHWNVMVVASNHRRLAPIERYLVTMNADICF